MMSLSGRVNNVLYEDKEKAFYILRMALDTSPAGLVPEALQNGLVAVTGHVPGMTVRVGTWLPFEAKWVTHQVHGPQLQIVRAPVLVNGWTPDVAVRMLASNGVGEGLLKSIRSHVGDANFLAHLADIPALESVPGVSKFAATHLSTRWASVRAHFQTVSFLTDVGIPGGLIKQIWAQFGDDAERVLSADPWSLVQVEGITFAQADAVATKLGLGSNDVRRVRGSVLWACRNQRGMGHVFMYSNELYDAVHATLDNLDPPLFARVLTNLHQEGLLVVDRTTRKGTTAVYEASTHTMESKAAKALLYRCRYASFDEQTDQNGKHTGQDGKDWATKLGAVGTATRAVADATGDVMLTATAAIEEWGLQSAIQLTEAQKFGVLNALTQPVSVLTGLPGTGKSTSCRAIVSILLDAGVIPLLLAPTGIAAKNLSTLTGSPAHTIHRAFGAKGKSMDDRAATYVGIVGDSSGPSSESTGEDWSYSAEKTHPASVVLIDESSMVDLHLLYRILSCTAKTCRLVFIGDADQLPSVGAGNILRDLITSDKFPVVSLRDIFRQQDASAIVVAAHAIHAGNVPKCVPPSDFVLLETSDDDATTAMILGLANRLYDRRTKFQILSPKHAGNVGVTSLNEKLRDLLNPRQPGLQEIKLGGESVREGDRVMVVRNSYQLGVFNGDVGKVARIDRAAKEIEIKVHGDAPAFVRFPLADAAKYLRLAYCCTIHKMQGLATDVIVMPVLMSFRHQLQRNLLYTAITRARKKVFLVGSKEALAIAVANDHQDKRNTMLADRLAVDLVP